MHMSPDELGALKRRESMNCDLKVITRKVADDKGDTIDLVTGLHQSSVSSYDSICRKVNGALVEVSKCLKETFHCEAQNLQQGICEPLRAAADRIQGPFAGAPGTVVKSLGLTICRAAGRGKSARPNTS